MTVPFMRAYTELLVRTCHTRGAHAIGGMAAFIPSRRDPEVNEIALARVREDKQRESGDGFDGTWVAHPDLVPVAKDAVRRRARRPARTSSSGCARTSSVEAADLLDVAATPGEITEAGVRANVSVGIRYIAAWLSGRRRGCDRQPHGGRRDRGDLALAGLAVGPPRPRRARRRRADRSREVAAELPGRARVRRGARALRAARARTTVFAEFLTLPAYEQLLETSRVDVRRHQGRRHRARARGGDRLGRDPAGQRAAAGASLRAVPGEPDAGARGAAAARRARARQLRAEPRRSRPHALARRDPRGVHGARRAREPRDRDRDPEDDRRRPRRARGCRAAVQPRDARRSSR